MRQTQSENASRRGVYLLGRYFSVGHLIPRTDSQTQEDTHEKDEQGFKRRRNLKTAVKMQERKSGGNLN